MKTRLYAPAAAGIVLFLTLVTSPAQTSITWKGTISTDWNNANNWNPTQVPTANDNVFISSGTVSIPIGGVFSNMYWTGGDITGSLTVPSGSTLIIGGPGYVDFALTNSGTINWTNGNVNMANLVSTAGPIVNLASGVWNIQCDQYWDTQTGPGYPNNPNAYIINQGLIRKTAGTGVTAFGAGGGFAVPMRNSGTVEADSGTIQFTSGGPISGTYTATTASSVIQFARGAFTAAAANMSGPGTFKFTGDSLTLSNDIITNLKLLSGTVLLGPLFQGGTITNLTIGGSTLQGTNIVSGQLVWTAGELIGSFVVTNGGILTIGGAVFLDGAITNWGTINWTNGNVNMANLVSTAGPIVNLASGVWNIQCDQYWDTQTGPGYPNNPNAYIINQGLIRKTAGTGVTAFGAGGGFAVPMRNSGTVEADSGTIQFTSGGPISGTYTATTASSVIQFARGAFTAAAANMSGPGTFKFTGDSLTLSNDIITNLKLFSGTVLLGPLFQGGTITNLTIGGSTLQGTNIVSGQLVWTAGELIGSFVVTNGGILTIGGAVFLDGAITNWGTINWTNGNVNMANLVSTAGPIVNLASGVWNIQCDQYWDTQTGPGYPNNPNAYIINQGLIRKTAGTGVTAFGAGGGFAVPMRNSGTVEADSGTIQFTSGGPISGTYTATTASSVIQFARGAFTAAAANMSGPGTIKFTGDSITFSNDFIPNLKISGTVLLGPLFQGGTITNLTIGGFTLQGTNIVSGQLVWTAGELAGVLIVTNGGTLTIGGPVFLDGAITNWGTINWTNGDVNVADVVATAGPVVNMPSGVWNIQCDHYFSTEFPAGYPTYPNAYIFNQGLFRKTANTSVTQIGYLGSYPVLFKNSGTVEADSGTINFEGGYQDSGPGSLVFAPAGLVNTNYGVINFNTKPTFSGPLNLSLSTRNGFSYSPGQRFSVFSFPRATNWFPCINGLDLGNGTLFQPVFTATNLSLLGTAYSTSATKPQLFILRSFGGVSVTWPQAFPAWTLQSATNLLQPVWTPMSACSDNVQTTNVSSSQFFRLVQ